MSKINIVPVFVPHYGCPNDCIFCNQRKITNQDYIKDFDETRKSIEEYLSYFSNREKTTQIAFYGGSFTGLPKDVMEEFLKIGKSYIDEGKVDSLRLSTRPDYIDNEILSTLEKYGVKTIELGVQSMVDEVLIANRRNHLSEIVKTSASLIKTRGFDLGLQQMLGLYKSNKERDIYTTDEFLKLEPDFVRIYPTLVIRDSFLEDLYNSGNYEPYSLEETIKVTKILFCMYYSSEIEIIRIGLQPTDNITLGKDVIAGPFHPSIRQLVLQSLYRDFMLQELQDFYKKAVTIYVNDSQINYLVGNKGANRENLIKKFKIPSLKFKSSENKKIYVESDNLNKELDFDVFLRNYIERLR
ncbi:radical SAM protein [Lagierella sp.]|uniref:elongator complex protein 3 n=1 Tax=Lagierella sp. TaxID=2849657 RepID=UPI0026385D95|nr:radical SAM protein [Lagierella sp.]